MVEGSLGGLQMIDLTPEGATLHKVLSVGFDPTTTSGQKLDMYKTCSESLFNVSAYEHSATGDTMALGFQLKHQRAHDVSFVNHHHQPTVGEDTIHLVLRMASLVYTHSPRFLNELSECATEFKDYMTNAAESLKYAATEVAMGLVSKRSELLGSSFYGSTLSLDGTPRRRYYSVDDTPVELEDEEESCEVALKLDVLLQTPVIVFPMTPSSPQVLVAHLGKISLQNSQPQPMMSVEDKDKIHVDVRHVSLYSLNFDEVRQKLSGLSRIDMCMRTDIGHQILQDTMVQFTVDRRQPQTLLHDFAMQEEALPKQTEVIINGKVVNPLRVNLSKSQYEQILKTVDNLTYTELVVKKDPDPETPVADVGLEPSMSAFKLDQASSRPFLPKPTTPPKRKTSSNVALKANFSLQTFEVEMRGDFGDGEQGLVDIKFQDFHVEMEKCDPVRTCVKVTLRALVVEDLLQAPGSSHRYLMVSNFRQKGRPSKEFISTSCPNSTILVPQPELPSSLPSQWNRDKPTRPVHSQQAFRHKDAYTR